MIQFNLLPDVKLDYIKAKRIKRFVILISITIAGALLAIMVLLFLAVNVFQKGHLDDLNVDIKKYSTELKSTQDLSKILTIQNQLNKLNKHDNTPGLHDKKPVASRLFPYLSQMLPDKLSIANLDVDFEVQTMSFTGGADSLSTINKFVDTLKFTTYKIDKEPNEIKAFSSVVLTNFGRDDAAATYQIDLKFDLLIFDSSKEISILVPKIITTRSETEKPVDLFQSTGSEQINKQVNE
ncbi:hypothetical protein HY003_00735 [Candidatus Saccharibacteria bacterium]|nr:hypothetical protein [Candidatus Saccharibacteria bacterium]MBI3337808.1 hypothetical protein [Candidatus Saccharibacteria bacterium]